LRAAARSSYCRDQIAHYKIPSHIPRDHQEVSEMSKSHDTKKDKKKPAQKTAKEKKQAKRDKKRP
jgi:hypothetical protein